MCMYNTIKHVVYRFAYYADIAINLCIKNTTTLFSSKSSYEQYSVPICTAKQDQKGTADSSSCETHLGPH